MKQLRPAGGVLQGSQSYLAFDAVRTLYLAYIRPAVARPA